MKYIINHNEFINEKSSENWYYKTPAEPIKHTELLIAKIDGSFCFMRSGLAYGFGSYVRLKGKIVEVEVHNRRSEPMNSSRTQCMCKTPEGHWIVYYKDELMCIHAEAEKLGPGFNVGDLIGWKEISIKSGKTKIAGAQGRIAKTKTRKEDDNE